MPDIVTVTSRESCLSRLGQAVVGVLFGLLLFVASFPLLWWNEGRAVRTARSLKEGASAVVSVPADRVDATNEGKLVHLTGQATTSETIVDPEFGVSANAIKLVRSVEMYQWQEEKKSQERTKLGGGKETVTTYTYDTRWASSAVDSSSFHEPSGHANPGALPFQSTTITAGTVVLGGFTLPSDLVAKIDQRDARPVTQADLDALPAGSNLKAAGAFFYRGENPSAPKVGDVRVKFEVIRPQVVSIVAVQRGSTFEAYQAKAGGSILMLESGTATAESMFRAAERQNTLLTWLLRLGGFLAMFIGLALVLRPIRVFADFIPFFGSVAGAGIGFISFLLAAVLSLVTMALAWIAYRPLLAFGLLAGGAVAVLLVVRRFRKRPAAAPRVVPPPIPTA